MNRVAVFVDAGYLFAQGSVAIGAGKKPRTSLVLNFENVVRYLKELAHLKSPDCKLLRIYWYDGAATGSRPTLDQTSLANMDDVKLRLGFINSHGQQKGVDSLIVTDLIELARQKSICDALLLSGDEDIRIGVQIAQNYGVRVHLLGIYPCRGSQSHNLMQEADTTTEWLPEVVSSFMTLRASELKVADKKDLVRTSPSSQEVILDERLLLEITEKFVSELDAAEIEGALLFWKTERGVPSDMDKRLLPSGRDILGRDFEREEIKLVRRLFRQLVEQRNKSSQKKHLTK